MMKRIFRHMKNNKNFYLYMFLFTVTNGIIRENLQLGSSERFIATLLLWGCVFLYATFETYKKLKNKM